MIYLYLAYRCLYESYILLYESYILLYEPYKCFTLNVLVVCVFTVRISRYLTMYPTGKCRVWSEDFIQVTHQNIFIIINDNKPTNNIDKGFHFFFCFLFTVKCMQVVRNKMIFLIIFIVYGCRYTFLNS